MARRRLEFGRDDPATARAGEQLVEAGWHPVCGHVRHASTRGRLEGDPSPALVYGLLPRSELRDRLTECDTCRPPEQMGIAL